MSSVTQYQEASEVDYNKRAPLVEKYKGKAPKGVKNAKTINHSHMSPEQLNLVIDKMDINSLQALVYKLNVDLEYFRNGKHKFKHARSVIEEIAQDETQLTLVKTALQTRFQLAQNPTP